MNNIIVTQAILDLIPQMSEAGFEVGNPIAIISLAIVTQEEYTEQLDSDGGFVGTRPGHGRPVAG